MPKSLTPAPTRFQHDFHSKENYANARELVSISICWNCEDFRTVSLRSYILKVFLKIIQARNYRKSETNMKDSQFGFRNGLGTREALFAVQVHFQRCKDANLPVF
ncbi:hypothetical protein ILUMI_14257 [Ignelater luminosus]|uniref:Uncharacterized protein n=1 Tax=Ignelater luminosus TaxID=2038154 RepID=A0A8K0GAM8_IGNLU|nr:hypothetical protein ILUMI_14257 [Ignelater luminosus]